ncbi:uncharacterized protein LACBIDRAFT_295432 [Laccaria bicolor S238N-H82]|uniref:Predicted protein n=1 Tax=Laccaria bicolor (strain S238N-H82 / ATCC MYA-4686) TaxID=486041 RepID=B0DSG6_LACBS|nr:uncharacterized protein LACBIDRAFT_295432 [Laccaria bicolor S238N-H82]EDR02470.1 predicted protein [Laccaria bicolor S238N-H82]|eukprot:XP_001886833.1 predicted protein [Laccaria bicolor S238N-H82]
MATNDFRNDGYSFPPLKYIKFSSDSFYPPIDKPPSGPLIFNNTNPSTYSTHPDEHTPTTPTKTRPRPTRQKSTQPTPKHSRSPTESKRSSVSATQSQGPNSRHRRERERALADIPTETLIQLVINEELEAQETRKVLSTTFAQLEASTRKAEQAEARGRMLEDEREAQALKITQAILDAQRESAKAKEDVAVYQLKLAHAEQEIQRAKEVVHAVENERDDAERAAVKARRVARELKERTVVQLAREEGRRAGFEEGIRQGRLLATVEIVEQAKPIPPRLLGDGTAFIEEAATEEQGRSPDSETHQSHSRRKNGGRSARATPRTQRRSLDTSMTTSRSRSSAPTSPTSIEAESSAAALRAIEERERKTVQMRLRMLERDLEHEKEKAAQVERERETERRREAERLRELEREKDRVREREHARLRELEAEREREREAAARERERERRLREKERESEERARENELKGIERQKRELEREREEREREKERLKETERALQRERERDKELDRERERELERERLRLRALAMSVEEQDSDGDEGAQTPRAAPSNQLQYLAMPPPPVIVMPATDTPMPVPMSFPSISGSTRHYPFQQQRTTSSGSSSQDHRNPRRRRTSDSGSSSSDMTQFDILTFPNPREERERERKLSAIPEVASSRGDSPNTNMSMDADEPTWVRNPPVDHAKVQGHGTGVDGWRSGVAGGSHYQPAYQPDDARNRGQFDQSLLTPTSNLTRRSSSSSSQYDINVEPPSPEVNRPSSRASFHEPEISQNLNFLSPNHRPAPLPTSSGRQQTRKSGDIPTVPNSPVLDASGLPPGFVPQSFTSPSPAAGGGGGGMTPIYGSSRPSSTAPGPGPKPSIYANPTRESADEGQGQGFVAPAPPAFSFTPRSTQNFLPVIPDAPSSAAAGPRGPLGPGMTPRAGTNGLPGGSGSGIYGRPNTEGSYETPRREGNGALPGGGAGVYGRPSEGQTYDPKPSSAYSSSSAAKSYMSHMPDPVIPSAEALRGTPRQRAVVPSMTPRAAGNNPLPGTGSGIYGRPSEGQTYDAGSATPRSTFPGGLTPLSGTQGLPGIYGNPLNSEAQTPRTASQGLPGGIYGRPNEGGGGGATPRQGMTPHSSTHGLPPVSGIYGRPTTDPSATPRQGMTPLLGHGGSGFPEASVPNGDDAGWGGNGGGDDGFDAATHQNTFLNSGVGSSSSGADNKPAAGKTKTKKKKR